MYAVPVGFSRQSVLSPYRLLSHCTRKRRTLYEKEIWKTDVFSRRIWYTVSERRVMQMQTVSQRMALLRQRMALRGAGRLRGGHGRFSRLGVCGRPLQDAGVPLRLHRLGGYAAGAGGGGVPVDGRALFPAGGAAADRQRHCTHARRTAGRAHAVGFSGGETAGGAGALGFDGRTVSTKLYRTLEKALAGKRVRMDGGFDPAEGVWPDRPPLSAAPVWAFDSGVTRREKLALLRQDMAARDAAYLLLTDLTDAAWTLELRGGDVACTPVFSGLSAVGQGGGRPVRPGGELPGGHSAAAGGGRRWRCAPTGTYTRCWRRCPPAHGSWRTAPRPTPASPGASPIRSGWTRTARPPAARR